MMPIGSSRPLTKPGDRFYWVEGGVYICLLMTIGAVCLFLAVENGPLMGALLSLFFFVPGGIILWAWFFDEKNYLERGGSRTPLFGGNGKARPKPKANPEYLRLKKELHGLKKEVRYLHAKKIKTEFIDDLLQHAEAFLMYNEYYDASEYLLKARTVIDGRWAIIKEREEKQTSQPKEVESLIKDTKDEELIE